MSNAVTSYFIGKAIGDAINGPDTRAADAASRASRDAAASRDDALRHHGNAVHESIEHSKTRVKLMETEEKLTGWRQYAGRLRTNLDARKMSESSLLEALKQENISNPLATAEGFEAKFQEMLAEQYGEADRIWKEDGTVIADRITPEMEKSVKEGRGAVS